jgi:CheY-like chemotaxis protein
VVEHGSLEGVRVLLVDDNQTNRLILHRQVTSWGMRDGSAASGAEALDCLRREAEAGDPFQLVVLDMQIPEMDGTMVARTIKTDPILRDTTIIILTSLAYHPDEGDLKSLGIVAHLTKPVKQSRLYDCLATVVHDRTDLTGAATRKHAQSVASLAAMGTTPLRVLVAEDNPVNQKVAVRLLEKLGIRADAVGNGLEVLDAIEDTDYDVILMDCQMPELDGYEATQRIRVREAATPGVHRQYVIAVTAHALEGDRELCLRAGMDDYVGKPIRIEKLADALDRCATARAALG